VVVWVKNLRARFCAFRLQPYIDAHLMRSRWLRPNVLAFSCERTAMNSDPTIKSRAFVCCNGGLGGGATMVRKWKHRC
jgi:hypothetical protein